MLKDNQDHPTWRNNQEVVRMCVEYSEKFVEVWKTIVKYCETIVENSKNTLEVLQNI